MKKQRTIRVCVDYRDVNQTCPKDNYPTPFIDQIIDECAECKIFSFIDGFSGYNQINIRPQDHSKTTFICPWGTFAYQKLPFGLKNAGATFQRAINYAFHEIKHIVQPYLDYFPAHSQMWFDHPQHLRAIFLQCQHYKRRLNAHKCVFCVGSGQLLGFVVSKYGIQLDPTKVQAILDLLPPLNLLQLQRLQGKANFLRSFIPNYAELARGFTHLLKKEVPFHWDQVAQASFDALKDSLIIASLMYAPNYQKYYYLYLMQIQPLAYRTSARNATGFTPFQLVYGLEAILPIQCEISSLKLAIELLPDTSEEEARFLELIHLDETHCDATLANEAHKKCIKAQYDKNVKPHVFSEGELVLLYDHESDKLGAGKFELLWMGPYIVKRVLTKGAYDLVDYDGTPL
eukprot:PITA_15798